MTHVQRTHKVTVIVAARRKKGRHGELVSALHAMFVCRFASSRPTTHAYLTERWTGHMRAVGRRGVCEVHSPSS